MLNLLIDVRIEGYFLQMLINRQSNIKNLLQELRDNQFIKRDIQDHTISFYNENGEMLILTDRLSKAIINQNDKSHKIYIKTIRDQSKSVKQNKKNKSESVYAVIEYEASQIKKKKKNLLNQCVIYGEKEQTEEEHQEVSKFFQQKINKILQKILHQLQKKNFQGLMKPKPNNKIGQKIINSLYKIGEHFMNLEKLNNGLDSALSKLCIGNQQSLKQLEKIKLQYSLPAQSCLFIDELKQKINKLNSKDKIRQISQIQKKFQEQVNSLKIQIKQLENQKNNSKNKIKNMMDQNQSVFKQIKDYQQKINELDFQKMENNLRSNENGNTIIECQKQLTINSNKLKQIENELAQKINQAKKYQHHICRIQKEMSQVIHKNAILQKQVTNLELNLKSITQSFQVISQKCQKLSKKQMQSKFEEN